MDDMESSHCENEESDIEKRYSTIIKRSKAGGKQKFSKIQKMNDNKSETCFFRSSHSELLFRKKFQINFEKFTGKHLCQSPATLLKKKLWYRCFPVNFAIFLRILLFLHNTSSGCFCIFHFTFFPPLLFDASVLYN